MGDVDILASGVQKPEKVEDKRRRKREELSVLVDTDPKQGDATACCNVMPVGIAG